jgi:hypothetical protein
MCACVHIEVFKHRLSGTLPTLDCSALDNILHAFTQNLLEEFNGQLGNNFLFQQWWMAMDGAKRIRIL